jgi:hypothetical protein
MDAVLGSFQQPAQPPILQVLDGGHASVVTNPP